MSRRYLPRLILVLGLSFAGPGRADDTSAGIPGPPRDVATIAAFGTDPPGSWEGSAGSNVRWVLTPGLQQPGFPSPAMRAAVTLKSRSDSAPGHNWFSLTRKLAAPVPLPDEAEGFRISLGAATESKWWIQPTLVTEAGEVFSLVLDETALPAGLRAVWTLPFDRFRSSNSEPLTLANARTIRTISLVTSPGGSALLLDKITAYRHERLSGWLQLTSSHPTNNLFERGTPVVLTLRPGGVLPDGAVAFRVAVRDYDGHLAAHAKVPLRKADQYTLPAITVAPGYYEVTAFWLNSAGSDIGSVSCIRAEGTVPDGIGTFSVLPRTLAENAARSRKLGGSAFFGLHGDFLGLGSLLGATWRLEYEGWPYQEPDRPVRDASGLAPWAKAALARPSQPTSQQHIQTFRLNLQTPSWADTDEEHAPGFAWADALANVRDVVRAEMHAYPHMAHRLYGGLWEADLNDPRFGKQKPPYGPTDIAEVYRRIREVVKAEDPRGLVIGPCSSVIRPDWFEAVFQAGVLKSLDGIETHAYAENTLSPEADDLPGRLHKLDALVRKYHGGRPLPIYITELGQPGLLGSDAAPHSQAERMARTCIILKGEGVRAFLPFYGIDYDRSGGWGFLYNLDIGAPAGPWETRRTTPKPMVNAVAACIDQLEGAEPLGRVRLSDPKVWAYAFRRGADVVTAVWSPTGPRPAAVPVRSRGAIDAVDMMGHPITIHPRSGVIRLTATAAPAYIREHGQKSSPAVGTLANPGRAAR